MEATGLLGGWIQSPSRWWLALDWLQEERQGAEAQGRGAGRFGLMASSFSRKDEPSTSTEECRVVCGHRGKHRRAISENRKMNFLGKVGRLARHEECQFEVCGHEFKAHPSAALARAWRKWSVGFYEGWDLARCVWWEGEGSLCRGFAGKQ